MGSFLYPASAQTKNALAVATDRTLPLLKRKSLLTAVFLQAKKCIAEVRPHLGGRPALQISGRLGETRPLSGSKRGRNHALFHRDAAIFLLTAAADIGSRDVFRYFVLGRNIAQFPPQNALPALMQRASAFRATHSASGSSWTTCSTGKLKMFISRNAPIIRVKL